MVSESAEARDVPGMKAVDRAVQVLTLLAEHPSGLSLSELAKVSAVPMTTLHRILAVLRKASLVGETTSGAHVIGVGAVILARAFLDGVDMREVARPLMAKLMAQTGETCHLGILASVHIVYIEKIDSPQSVRMHSRVGATNPAPGTAIGRAILAYSPHAVVKEVLDGAERLFGIPQGLDRSDDILAAVRHRGYSTDLQENEAGICCVGAPIFDHTGRVVAGLSVSAPASRFDPSTLPERGEQVRAAAAMVSNRLGWSGEDSAPSDAADGDEE